MDPTYVQGLHDLLLQATSPDTLQVKGATAKLNLEYYKNATCILGLAQIIATSAATDGVRQLAAVEMRKRVAQNSGSLWTQLAQNDRGQLKQKLFEIVLADPINLVRHSVARVIAAVANIEFPLGAWPELLPFLQTTCTSSQSIHREVGIFILYTVLDNIVEGFKEHLDGLFTLFTGLLNDPESLEVRITTVRAMSVIAAYLDAEDKAEVKAFQASLPLIMQVIGQCVQSGNEPGARQLFDVLETLLILEVPVLGKHIPELAEFLLQLGGNRTFDPELRVLSLNALNWTIVYKKSKIQSNNLAGPILHGLMPITAEEEPEDVDDDAPSRSALRIIDGLATGLPPSQVFPPLRNLITEYFSSSDANNRRGAMLALGICVEGCSEYMTPLLGAIWPVIEAGIQDSDAGVRKASCVAVCCLCEWLSDECVARHEVLVPGIMNLVNDPATQRAACTALDALLEILHDHIGLYLTGIMEHLTGLLVTAPVSVKSVVIGAMGSAAHAAKEAFLPYFQPIMERLQPFLSLTNEGEEVELRGITVDAIGTFAEAVGKDVFRPFFPEMMKQAFQGLEIGSPRLRECSFLFFGVMAKVFEDEFAVYLQEVVPALLKSCAQVEQGEEFSVLEATNAFGTGSDPQNAITIVDEKVDVNGNNMVEIEDIDVEKMMDANSAIAVEKEIAADTIGTLFAATKSQFLPFVEQCTMQLIDLLSHYYEGIRKSATDSLLEIIRTFYELSGAPEWQAGLNYAPLPSTVKDLNEHALKALLEMYETEDNKSVVTTLCNSLAETITKIGPAFVDGHLDEISKMAIEILDQKAECQQDPDQDEDEEAPEDQAEYETVLIASAGDVVSAIANALGADFAPAFSTFYPLIAKYYKKSRSLNERSSTIGCLAEIISGMKGAITPSTEPLLELCFKALGDPEADVLSNAAFAVGLLVENSEMDLTPQYLPLLGALRPLFNVTADSPSNALNAKDNAAGAVSRMIVRNVSAVPLDQVLPVLVGGLPLRNDPLENRPVFRALFYLFRTNGAALHPFISNLLPVFAHVLDPSAPDQVGDEIRAELIQLIGALNAEDPGAVQAAGLGVFVPGA
ncbi:Importin N-terminal domain-containing protein [Mycena indigotica]|uniref:Importin N-terminal domain-containing protein n=1 Tax=Mycena indigotica TaxID=2126181 RepID=A0A8H6T0L1_9AGAR|nr:Importin N-terminal domain-containing protein [Mycena indigotica]KAF7309755.1 Importin N-terminal domain-containing protein [Mycena indigotica]